MANQEESQTTLMMEYPNILIYKGTRCPFNPDNIVYAKPKITNHGGYVIGAQYKLSCQLADGSHVTDVLVPIILQTPVMTTTFGMSSKEHDGKIKGNVDVTFYDQAGPDVHAFKQVMGLWDRKLLALAKKNKSVWFNSNKITDAILDYLYISMIRKNVRKTDQKEFSDSFRAKIPRRQERFECEVYNAAQQPIPIDELTRMSEIRELCRLSGIWISETMFVASFEAIQIQKVGEGRMTGFSFVGDEAYGTPNNTEDEKEENEELLMHD
jgi:hypothetical protein